MIQTELSSISDSAAARDYLVSALRMDLIGPRPSDREFENERLRQTPSRWYLTGFLVPSAAPIEQRAQDDDEEFDEPADQAHGSDDSATPDRGSGKRNYLPSSIGLNIIVEHETEQLDVQVTWGDYVPEIEDPIPGQGEVDINASAPADGDARDNNPSRPHYDFWERRPRQEALSIPLSGVQTGLVESFKVPGHAGLQIACLARPTTVRTAEGDIDARAVSLFLINRRKPAETRERQDTAYVFQIEMTVKSDRPFVPQPNPHGLDSEDWDERLSDLHFRDVAEYAVGYNVSTSAETVDGVCHRVKTEWMPQGIVQRTEACPDSRC